MTFEAWASHIKSGEKSANNLYLEAWPSLDAIYSKPLTGGTPATTGITTRLWRAVHPQGNTTLQQSKTGSQPARRLAANDNYRGGHRALNWIAKRDPHAALAVQFAIRDSGAGVQSARSGFSPTNFNADDVQTHEVPDDIGNHGRAGSGRP